VIYDIAGAGPDHEVVLTDGRRFNFSQLNMINCVKTKPHYNVDEGRIQFGMHTIILRGGNVIYGRVIDFRGSTNINERFFELLDGRQLPWQQVARIYFR
jgi:hypothetical protein